MKNRFFTIAALCTLPWGFIPLSVAADSPQPGVLQFTLVSKTVSLGEPLILQYTITNSEHRRIGSNVNENPRKWLTMSLIDGSGHSFSAAPPPVRNSVHSGLALGQESVIGSDEFSRNSVTGCIIVSQILPCPAPGRYRLKLFTHQKYYWDEAPGEPVMVDQDFFLPVTVTAKDLKRLHATAEKYRQSVLHDSDYWWAVKALFSMRDPDCLPVWRELTTDPTLDAFRAMEVISELVDARSLSASDILAEMQPIAPERWSQTGTSPFSVLQNMWITATPELKQHINQLMTDAGSPRITERTKAVGSVN